MVINRSLAHMWCFSTIEVDGTRHIEAVMQPDHASYPRARRCFLESGFRTAPASGITRADARITIRDGRFAHLDLPKFEMALGSDQIPMTGTWMDVASRRGFATVMLTPPGTWRTAADQGEIRPVKASLETRHEAVTRQMILGKVLWAMARIAIE